MTTEDSFIGSGWSFPPRFSRNQAKLEMTSGIEDIHKSLEIIFKTSLGERIMNPKFGCSLQDMVYETINTSVIAYIQKMVETAVLYHEPRIDAENIDIQEDANLGVLLIKIDYKVRGANSRFNFVYPFYLQEASG